MTTDPVTLVKFNDLDDILRTRFKLNVYDVFDAGKHFYQWHKAKGLPKADEDGKHPGSSQIWMKAYQADPDGAAVCPPYFNLWHWLLRISERSEPRRVHVPLSAMLIVPYTPMSGYEREAAAMRLMIQIYEGKKLPGETPAVVYEVLDDLEARRAAEEPGLRRVIEAVYEIFDGWIMVDIQANLEA